MDCRVLLLASQQARKKPCGFNIIASFTSSLNETDPRFQPKKSPKKAQPKRGWQWLPPILWLMLLMSLNRWLPIQKWPGEGCCVSSATDGSSTICGAWSEDDGGRKAWVVSMRCLSIQSSTSINPFMLASSDRACWSYDYAGTSSGDTLTRYDRITATCFIVNAFKDWLPRSLRSSCCLHSQRTRRWQVRN